MGLVEYKKKRSFKNTPEPTGGRTSRAKLHFVVQKHAASRLHYDFRLEMEGVLKSWAIPKGPTLDPSVRRLAMMVEDHPFDYRDFEGIIPEGNYGAGTVIVWDEGTFEPIEKFSDKKSQEKHLLKQLREGSLKFILHGKKLKGEFALVRTNGMGDNAWLFIKHRDKYATTSDVTDKDKSVQSGKTIEKVASSSTNFWGSNRKAKSSSKTKKTVAAEDDTPTKKTAKKAATKAPAKKSASKKPASAKTGKKKVNEALSNAPEAPFPKTIAPMLATLVDKPFDEPGWIYEIKWDG
ncbi:MAG: DNA ligase, partial [Bacteroidota bacterium]|nr:DNA ligase [Bacteroidota bacterium]